MEKLPPEICTKIFSSACLDTGFTGCSLSLVSKYVHEASLPTRLQSVSLRGHRQILAFASMLDRMSPHLRRIQHLFISSNPLPPCDTDNMNKTNGDKEIAGAVLGILKNAARRLELLDLALTDDIESSIDPARISLPRLKELTTNGIFVFRQLEGDQITLTLEPCHELRRLHVSQPIFIDYYDLELFGHIGRLAPSLTHLRLSAPRGSHTFPLTLQAALQPLLEHIGNQSQTCTLPASLTKVLVQSEPPRRVSKCGTPRIRYYHMLESLRVLQERDGRIVLLKHKREGEAGLSQLSDGLSDWRDRVDGGEGCWNLDDRLLEQKNLRTR